MTNELLDKVMKPYWFGFVLNNDVLVGCPVEDLSSGSWFYGGSDFIGGKDIFDITKGNFLSAMRRYLNKTYNVDIKSII